MSIIKIDGFDGYGTPANQNNFASRMFSSGWTGSLTFPPALINNSRTGIGFTIDTGYYGTSATAFDLTSEGVVVGFAFNPGGLGFRRMVSLSYDNYAGSVDHSVVLYQNPTGAISVGRLPPGGIFPPPIFAHTPVNSIYSNTWHYIEVKLHGTYVEIRVDGNTVLSTNGPIVAPGANLFYVWGGGPGTPGANIDDLYILRMDGIGASDFLGDCVVHTMFPIADAGPNNTSQFGGGITHASAVNGLPEDESSAYLFSNTSGQEDLFSINDLPADMIDILAMQVNVRAKKDSAGVAQYKLALKSGATLALSPARIPTTSFHELSYMLESNPAGGAWTKVAAQAAEIGFQVV